jgi:hypothetical protein
MNVEAVPHTPEIFLCRFSPQIMLITDVNILTRAGCGRIGQATSASGWVDAAGYRENSGMRSRRRREVRSKTESGQARSNIQRTEFDEQVIREQQKISQSLPTVAKASLIAISNFPPPLWYTGISVATTPFASRPCSPILIRWVCAMSAEGIVLIVTCSRCVRSWRCAACTLVGPSVCLLWGIGSVIP